MHVCVCMYVCKYVRMNKDISIDRGINCGDVLAYIKVGRSKSSYVYLLYYVCIAVFTLDAGLLARSQYSEGPAPSHLDTGFSWFPCA